MNTITTKQGEKRALGTASVGYVNGYPISVSLFGPRGGFIGSVDINPRQARILAEQALNAAADMEAVEAGATLKWWNVNMRDDTGREYTRGIQATRYMDAFARAVAWRNMQQPDDEIVSVVESPR